MEKKILELTKKLVSIPSQNSTRGERLVCQYMYDYIASFPYFKMHPELVMAVPLKDDPLGRMNVIALLIGEKGSCNDTIILHGHTDTVGVEDYGSLKEFAFDCDTLMEKMLEIKDSLASEVRADLESGDYLFGRGACDMKGGDAVHITILETLSEKPEMLSGNILLSLNPVEESLHAGFTEATAVFALL